MQGVDHHFIDHVSIKEDYSVGRFEAEVMKCLDHHFLEHDTAILVVAPGFICEPLPMASTLFLIYRQPSMNSWKMNFWSEAYLAW
jgi:hypothetical protein